MWRVMLEKLVGAVKTACREAIILDVEFPVPQPSHTASHSGYLHLKVPQSNLNL